MIKIPLFNYYTDAFSLMDNYIKFYTNMNNELNKNGKILFNDYNPEVVGRNSRRIFLSMYGDTNNEYFSYDKINPELLIKKDGDTYGIQEDAVIELLMHINGSTTYMLSFSDFLYKTVSINNVQLAVTINDDSLDMLDSPYSQY
jgi:hypothetical protein